MLPVKLGEKEPEVLSDGDPVCGLEREGEFVIGVVDDLVAVGGSEEDGVFVKAFDGEMVLEEDGVFDGAFAASSVAVGVDVGGESLTMCWLDSM